MIRFLIRAAVYLVAAAIGLLVASLVLDGFSVSASSFLYVVVIFALVQSVITPLITQATGRNAPALAGGASLFSALIALIVTAAISDGLTIDGLGTWIGAAVIIWLVSMVAAFLLPLLLVKMGVQHVRERRAGD
jgi:uncharacterized membrane protein YvlD (DUF360 family)